MTGKKKKKKGRPIYQPPVLIPLGELAAAEGQHCRTGGTAGGQCRVGPRASSHCYSGTSASKRCFSGSRPDCYLIVF